jgi:hypothetical protein
MNRPTMNRLGMSNPRNQRIERVQRKFVKYALRGLELTDKHDRLANVDRCANSCVILIFHFSSGKVNLQGLLSLVNVNTIQYHARKTDFLNDTV